MYLCTNAKIHTWTHLAQTWLARKKKICHKFSIFEQNVNWWWWCGHSSPSHPILIKQHTSASAARFLNQIKHTKMHTFCHHWSCRGFWVTLRHIFSSIPAAQCSAAGPVVGTRWGVSKRPTLKLLSTPLLNPPSFHKWGQGGVREPPTHFLVTFKCRPSSPPYPMQTWDN